MTNSNIKTYEIIETRFIPLDKIEIDPALQTRAKIYPYMVDEYAEILQDGSELEPIDVFVDEEKHPEEAYIMAGGHHRYQAHKKVERKEIRCNVYKGNRRDILIFALKANARNGFRLTNKDKNKIAEIVLTDPVWKDWTANALTDLTGLCQAFLSKKRRELEGVTEEEKVRICKDGRKINTQNIGKGRRIRKKAPANPATLPNPETGLLSEPKTIPASTVSESILPDQSIDRDLRDSSPPADRSRLEVESTSNAIENEGNTVLDEGFGDRCFTALSDNYYDQYDLDSTAWKDPFILEINRFLDFLYKLSHFDSDPLDKKVEDLHGRLKAAIDQRRSNSRLGDWSHTAIHSSNTAYASMIAQ